MTDIGVVGHASVTIDPDFTGFAESVRTRLLPVLKQASADVKRIDATVQALAKSMSAAVVPAKQLADQISRAATRANVLNSAMDAIDAGDLGAVSGAATNAAFALDLTALNARAAGAALDSIDAGDLRGVTAAAASATGALTTTAGAATAAGGAAATSGSHFDGLGKAAKGAALVAAGGFAAVGAAAGLAIKAAVDFETAFTGVTKTVDGSAEQIAGIRQGIIDMARQVPASTTEISAIAEAAGALGVETDKILEFSRVMIDLGNTTNVTADEAATAFAKIANVLGTPQDKFDEMGATLVDLGNKGASTEAEILGVANRVAAAGQVAGLTEQQVLGLSATLANVGIHAEMGGSAIQKTFFDMQAAIDEGGPALQAFAKVAGMSAQQFASAYKTDAMSALQSFTAGLAKIEERGGSASGVLADLDIKEIRQVQTLLKLASAQDVMTRDQQVANTAWAENTALVDEASKRYATTESQLKILKNQATETARVVGEGLLPTFVDTAKSLTESLGPAFATLGSVAGPALAGLVGTIGKTVGPILEALAPLLKVLGESLTKALEAVSPHIGRFVEILSGGLIDALIIATPAFVKLLDALAPLLPQLAELAVAILIPLTETFVKLIDIALIPLIDLIDGRLIVVLGLLAGAWGIAHIYSFSQALGSAVKAVIGLAGSISSSISSIGVAGTLTAILNPIGLIIAGVAAIAAGFTLAYFKVQPFRDFIDGLWDSFQTGLDAVRKLVSELWPQFLASDVFNDLKEAASSLWDVLQTGAQKATEIWDTSLKPALMGLFESLQPVISWFIDNWETLAKILGVAAAAFLAVANPIPALIAGFVALYTQSETFRNIVNGIIEALKPFVSLLVELAGGIITDVINLVSNLVDVLVGIFTFDWDKIKEGLGGIWEVIENLFGQLGSFLGGFAAEIGYWLLEGLKALGPLVAQGLGLLWEYLEENWQTLLIDIGLMVSAIPRKLIEWLGDLGSLLFGWLQSAFAFAVEKGPEVLAAIGGFIADIPKHILNILSASLSFLFTFFWDAAVWLVQNGPQIMESIVGFVQQIPGWIVGGLSALGSFLFDVLKAAWQFAIDKGPELLAALFEFVKSIPGKIVEAAQSLGSTLFDWLKAAFVFVVEKGPELIGGVIDWFKELPGKIFDAIKNGLSAIGGAAVDIGKTIFNAISDFLNEHAIDPIRAFKVNIGPVEATPFEFIPRIPHLAQGGIVNGATLALIGEAGREAVIPDDPVAAASILNRFFSTEGVSAVGDTAVMPANGSSFLGDLFAAGGKVGQAFLQGVEYVFRTIQVGGSSLDEATRSLVDFIERAARDQADANSPAGVMIALGEDMSAGLAIGLMSGMGEVSDAAATLVNTIARPDAETMRAIEEGWYRSVGRNGPTKFPEAFEEALVTEPANLSHLLAQIRQAQGQGISLANMRITEDFGAIYSFAAGGVVPGPVGAPVPAIVHGGERISRPGAGGDVYVSIGNISGVGAGEAVQVGDIIGERVANRLAIRAAIRSA